MLTFTRYGWWRTEVFRAYFCIHFMILPSFMIFFSCPEKKNNSHSPHSLEIVGWIKVDCFDLFHLISNIVWIARPELVHLTAPDLIKQHQTSICKTNVVYSCPFPLCCLSSLYLYVCIHSSRSICNIKKPLSMLALPHKTRNTRTASVSTYRAYTTDRCEPPPVHVTAGREIELFFLRLENKQEKTIHTSAKNWAKTVKNGARFASSVGRCSQRLCGCHSFI